MLQSATNDNKSISVQDLRSFWEQKTQFEEPRQPQHKHELVACNVKTITIQGILFYEIEFNCNECKSSFKIRTSHDCESNGGTNGLEWIETNDGENVNLAF